MSEAKDWSCGVPKGCNALQEASHEATNPQDQSLQSPWWWPSHTTARCTAVWLWMSESIVYSQQSADLTWQGASAQDWCCCCCWAIRPPCSLSLSPVL